MILAPTIPAVIACRTYLMDQLPKHGVSGLPVAVVPPRGEPERYVRIELSGTIRRSLISNDYLLRVLVFDRDAVDCARNADIISALMLGANHTRITVDDADVWVSATRHQVGPRDISDPDAPLFGSEIAAYWTIAPKPA